MDADSRCSFQLETCVLSYGLLGNQADAGPYILLPPLWHLNGGLGGLYILAMVATSYTKARCLLVNPNTTWEKVESKNIGLDFGFFGNSL